MNNTNIYSVLRIRDFTHLLLTFHNQRITFCLGFRGAFLNIFILAVQIFIKTEHNSHEVHTHVRERYLSSCFRNNSYSGTRMRKKGNLFRNVPNNAHKYRTSRDEHVSHSPISAIDSEDMFSRIYELYTCMLRLLTYIRK